jgi:hypothetical protein
MAAAGAWLRVDRDDLAVPPASWSLSSVIGCSTFAQCGLALNDYM